MEYVFGTEGADEVLKTKGREHTDLTGFHVFETKYPDQIITDNFHVAERIGRAKDAEGNCYDWYIIDKHYRVTDKFTPNKADIETGIADAQDATCELSEKLDERISELEDALCELTMEG